MKLSHKETERIENKVLSVSYKLCLVASLAKTIEEVNCNSDNIEKRDIAGLLMILNTYIKMMKSKMHKLELHLIKLKRERER